MGQTMSDALPRPEDDDTPPADPFEAELVAYLDGELDPAAARRVEARLATDPAAREKAAALKKTYDLLDYLPRPEPSPDFTTKTLDRLPAVKAAAAPADPPSSSVPVVIQTGPLPLPAAERQPARRGLWAAGLLVAVGACAAAGYFASATLRPAQPQAAAAAPEELPISDRGVVENLPLYAAADDLDFVRALAESEYFGDAPGGVAGAKAAPLQLVPAAKPSGLAFEALAESFKALPPTRQDAIRELHKQLAELPDADERGRLVRVLEVYAIWLDRLPPTERKSVLAAATGAHRLDEVRALRERQWVESLPLAQRDKLRGLPAAEKAELIGQWRRAEAERREEWELAREHADDIAADRAPWPFGDPALKKEVVEFVRATFHTDRPLRSRLTKAEFERLSRAFDEAEARSGWAWHAYGKAAYDLTRKYEAWLLPEPAAGEPVTRPDQLPRQAERYTRGPGAKLLQVHEGKWPDFALAVHNLSQFPKGGERLPPLGPAKAADFREPLRSFVAKDLSRVLTLQEKRNLEQAEGKWPDYPREVTRLARLHNLSAPGMMLPGAPRQWDAMYRTRPTSGPGRGPTGRP